jgi:carbonic anhydrase/SulP family sulfate permease
VSNSDPRAGLSHDLTAGLIVFFIALPLCLGLALALGVPPLAGLLSGAIGGVLVGALSGSHTSVSGPSAGLTAVVAAQIAALGSFEAFLLAVVLAGLIQIGLGLARAGAVAAFFPSAVVKGLLAAVGVILVLKQLPHVVGHDSDPEGDMAFQQPDERNTFSELVETVGDLDLGAALIGLVSVALLLVWDRSKRLKASPVPAPLVVVLLGVGLSLLFRAIGGAWVIEPSHRVRMPVPDDLAGFFSLFRAPDFAKLGTPAVYLAAVTLAAVASLETLLNLEAVDKIDPRRRASPPNRELIAQGLGNVAAGLVGGLPISSAIVRSSVNVNAGARSKLSTVIHGLLLLIGAAFLGRWFNEIPLSCLAAVLLVTGMKLASPALFRRMWGEGPSQFVPFAATLAAIVFTDLLVGVLLGLAVCAGFVLRSNVRRPLRRIVEKHLGGEVVRVELANQVSFLNRAALARTLDAVPRGGDVLLDARDTDYIDPDVLGLIREYVEETGPARGVKVSLLGFRTRYQLEDQTQYVDYSTRELQSAMSPRQVWQILADGNERFRTGRRLTRDLNRQVSATAAGQHPLAVVLSCIDSRAPAELVFDLGVGDILNVRVAGNVTSPEVIGSVEYGCAVAGVRLVLVMGHTRCGAVGAAVTFWCSPAAAASAAGCRHLAPIMAAVQASIAADAPPDPDRWAAAERQALVEATGRRNVARSVAALFEQSPAITGLVRAGHLAVVGAVYDVATGAIELLPGVGEGLDGPRTTPGVD